MTTRIAPGRASPGRHPLRVLHLRDSPWVDGPGRTIIETGVHLDPARVSFHIGAFVSDASSEHPLVAEAQERGLNVHRIVDGGGFDRGLYRAIVQLVDDLGIDILHTSDIRSNVYGAFVRRDRPALRLVATTHGWIANDIRRKVMRIVDKAALRQFDAVIMVSNAMRRLVPSWWLPSERITVLHNALVLEQYGRDHLNAPRRSTDPSGEVVVLNVGRLSPEKGQDLLLHAIARLVPRFKRLRLKFAGTGPLQRSLEELAESLGVADRLEFLGYVHDMPALYREVDVVVQSSLTEGLPNVILEAAYLRVPIVATDVGGTSEVIEDGRSGCVVKPGSIDELVRGLERFLDDPQSFAAMGQIAHETIRHQFSFSSRTDRLIALYEKIAVELAKDG